MELPKVAGQQFQPAKYEERGAAVPFTTPTISQARVRKDNRDKLELTVAAFAGVKGNFVIRWKDIPEIFQNMTMHDRSLHEEITKINGCGPGEVRKAALTVARTGLAGPEAARNAAQALAEDENEALLTKFFLFKSTLSKLTGGEMNLKVTDIISEQGREHVKAAMSDVAHELNVSTQDLYARLEDWGDVIAPIGVPGMPKMCRLRRLTMELEGLAKELDAWAETDRSDAAGFAIFVGQVARFTQKMATDLIKQIDEGIEKSKQALARWDKAKVNLVNAINRIWWIVDGWEFVTLLWRNAARAKRDDQRAVMIEIMRILPLVPEKEAVGANVNRGELDVGMQRFVRAMRGWNSGEPDFEMIRRIESMKKARL